MNFDTSFSTRVRVECHQDARVVALPGEHDVSTAPLVRERLAQARTASGVLVVDMTAATFVDTTLAMTLLEAFRADTPPRLRFVMPAATFPRRAFSRMGFATGLPVYDRLEDALTDQTARSRSNSPYRADPGRFCERWPSEEIAGSVSARATTLGY